MENGTNQGQSIKAELYFDDFEVSRGSLDIRDYSLNGYTKMSPLTWVQKCDDLAFFLDIGISRRNVRKCDSKVKIAVLLEPVAWAKGVTRAALALKRNFDAVLTFDDELLKFGAPFMPYVPGGIQLKPENVIPAPNKVSLLSMSASAKNELPGHILRHQIAERFSSLAGFSVMGGGYDPYDSPNQPFSTFAYSVVVENSKSEFNVTEKLLQSLLNECVPIYWGAPLEHLGFNLNGIISFTDIGELPKILSEISIEDFESRRSAVQENFKVAQTYMSKEINILRSISGLPGLEQFTDLGKMRSGFGFDEPVEPGRTYTENQITESFLGRLLRQWRYRFQFAWHITSVLRVNKILGSRG